jgi:HemY protein
MRRILLFLLALSALVVAAVWLANDPGVASLTWRGWRLETSVGVLLVLIVIVVLVLGAVLRLLAWVRGGLQAFTARRREKRVRRGLVTLGDGFSAVHAGQGAAARRLAQEAANLLGDSPAVLVLRKQAAALDGDAAELKAAAEALLERPETEMAALRALSTRALKDGDVIGAVSYARRAMTRGETPAWAVHLTLDSEIAAGRWSDAITVLDSAAGRDVYAPSELQRLRARLRVHQAQALLAEGQPVPAARTAQRAMDEGGGIPAVAIYAKAMAAQGKGRKAASDIERAFAQQPDAALVAAYRALVPGETSLDWARRVETLVQSQPDHAESRLAVAEASLGAELWGRARNRLGGLTSDLQPGHVRARAARLMADLENGETGDSDAVARWLREAMKANAITETLPTAPTSAAALLAQV